jgi:tetratricopeptide (TPR) repeat protein
MNLALDLLQQINNPGLNCNERARLRCLLAKEMEEAGNYEAGQKALGELWRGEGVRPALDGLDTGAAGEVLLRAGTLSGWLGSTHQIIGAQERAKDLLSESISLFEKLPDVTKVAEAQTELAYCYWREGAYDEARITLREALARLVGVKSDLRAVALIRSAIVERTAKRSNDALRILTEAAPILEASGSEALKGSFHNELATTLENLSATEQRDDYTDRALL